jgi:hypothetical protein
MSAQALKPAKHYARLICKHMKELPDRYADDPQDVQTALGLSDLEFNLGLDLCIQRGVIKLEKNGAPPAPAAKQDEDETEAARPTSFNTFMKSPSAEASDEEDETLSASPFKMEEEDKTEAASPFTTGASKAALMDAFADDEEESPESDLAQAW